MINEEVQAVPLDEFAHRLLRRPVQYIVVEVPRYILHPCNVCAFGGFGLEAAPAQSDTDLADRLLRELTPERLGEAAGTDEELQEAPCVRSECSQYDEQEAIDLHAGGNRCEKMPPEAPTSAKKKLAASAWQKLLGISAAPQPARNKCHGKKPKNRQNGRLHPHKNPVTRVGVKRPGSSTARRKTALGCRVGDQGCTQCVGPRCEQRRCCFVACSLQVRILGQDSYHGTQVSETPLALWKYSEYEKWQGRKV